MRSSLSDSFSGVSGFQSTHSITECDLSSIFCNCKWCKYFNPRTPLQSAIITFNTSHLISDISIHALHYRVRFDTYVHLSRTKKFQSTHSITECDRHMLNFLFPRFLFQSTHSITECDSGCRTQRLDWTPFQSTHSITECDIAGPCGS